MIEVRIGGGGGGGGGGNDGNLCFRPKWLYTVEYCRLWGKNAVVLPTGCPSSARSVGHIAGIVKVTAISRGSGDVVTIQMNGALQKEAIKSNYLPLQN